tara:strand:+ start:697 stop:1131 length:435 start_codon:yes stop_codon:yes gene_type:complete
MANLWNVMGYAYHNNASISGNAAPFAVTRDATNSKLSAEFPRNCEIESVEIFLTSIAGGASDVTMYLARDSTGDVAITPGGTTGATQTITSGFTSNTGSVVFEVESDFNFDDSVTNATAGTLYVVLRTDAGTATADVRVNWRGI